jgi:hypothetical protein
MSKKNILPYSLYFLIYIIIFFFWGGNFYISTNNLINVEAAKVLLWHDKYSLSTYL